MARIGFYAIVIAAILGFLGTMLSTFFSVKESAPNQNQTATGNIGTTIQVGANANVGTVKVGVTDATRADMRRAWEAEIVEKEQTLKEVLKKRFPAGYVFFGVEQKNVLVPLKQEGNNAIVNWETASIAFVGEDTIIITMPEIKIKEQIYPDGTRLFDFEYAGNRIAFPLRIGAEGHIGLGTYQLVFMVISKHNEGLLGLMGLEKIEPVPIIRNGKTNYGARF